MQAIRLPLVAALCLGVIAVSGYATTSRVLDNGLVVIAERSTVSPLVAVSVVYKVGSRNEVVGKTGASHFVEHMLFNGTEKYPGDTATKEILKNGGIPNGETYWDFTHLGGVLPSDKIDIILDIEADRMANATVDSLAVEEERDIILEELAMRGEAPIVVLLEDLVATAFKVHPYHHWYPGGYFSDVLNLDPAYVRQFYKKYYQPGNAIISIVGNMDEEDAIAKVNEYFKNIEGKPLPEERMAEEPEQKGLRRVTVRGDALEGRIMIFFKGPKYGTRDWEAGSVMTQMLANGKSTYLNRRLVETGFASQVDMVLLPTIDPFGFLLMVSVPKNEDLKKCEKAIYHAIEEFKQDVPRSEDVERAKTRIEGLTILQRQTVRARALELATAEVLGDWQYADQYLENIKSITPDDIQRVATRYLDWRRATIGWLIPKDSGISEGDLIGMKTNALKLGFLPQALEGGAVATRLSDARYEKLPNGVTLILKEDHNLPIVAIRTYVLAGACYEPDGRSGLARLTVKTVAMGSKNFPYDYLYSRIEALGSNLKATSDLERAHLSLSVLSSHWREAVEMITDILTSPSLSPRDFKRARREVLSEISQIEEDAREIAFIEFRKHFYGDHPYARPEAGRLETVKNLSLRHVKQFYNEAWTPEGAVVAVVGDFDTPEMLELLEKRLVGWKRTRTLPTDLEAPPQVSGFNQVVKTMPEKRQVKLFWGMQGPSHKDPDYEAFQVMNFIFGGQVFGSRLFDRIREKESLAYIVNSQLDLTRQPGAVYIHLGTRPKNVARAIDAVEEEVERMKSEPVTTEEIEITKNFLISLQPFITETYGKIARRLEDIVFYDLPHDYFDTFPERISKVKREDIEEAARRYLDLDNSVLVIVGAVDENLDPVSPKMR